MRLANNTAFLMGLETINKLKWFINQKEKRMDYNRKIMNDLIDELAFILDQYPILINHPIWEDVEKKIILERLVNPNLKAIAIKLPNNSNAGDVLIIDYEKNTSYVRQQKK